MTQHDLFYGTEPHKLARRRDPVTSHHAAEKVDSTRWERRVHNIIQSFGRAGAIQDEVIEAVYERYGFIPYSTITARFKGLEEKGLITYTGDTRKGRSGRSSRVRVSTEFA